ncbi:MAG: DUF222 domain-containing protein [Micromonosporaceae bacterium]
MFEDVEAEGSVLSVGVRIDELSIDPFREYAGSWAGLPPTGLLLDVLSNLSAGEWEMDAVLDAAAAVDRVISFAQSVQANLLARVAALRPGQGRQVSEFAADEVAPVLRVSRAHAAARLALSADLSGRLPATLDALRRGEIDLGKARVISEGTGSLEDTVAVAVQDRVLPRAPVQTVPQLRAAVRRAVLRLDPEGARRREKAARGERRVVCTPAPDGMAELYALLPAPEAMAIYDRVSRLARSGAADGRTADQRRADCFTDLLLGPERGVSARVNVTVAASTLLGEDALPGHLDGYGPIGADTAREIAGGALTTDTTWRRLLTDPADGAVTDVGRRGYRPPAALADRVKARDQTCRFPGCRHRADRCDLDHTVPFPDGATSLANLGTLCRHHHRLKHETDWSVTQDSHGRFTWRSPTGREYVTDPAHAPP